MVGGGTPWRISRECGIPWWAFLGGAIGVTCMAAMNRTVPIVGVAILRIGSGESVDFGVVF